MIKLFDLSDNALSRGIKSLSPILYDGIKIENKLLDGSTHVQTIGTAQQYLTFDILANHNQVNYINNADSIGETLKLIVDDNYYIGFCSVPDWQRVTKRYANETDRVYTTSAKLVISESGVI